MVEMKVKKVTNGKESNMVAFDFERTPITQIADYIIITASNNQASDIHFDPRTDGMMVRFRIDGDLQDYTYIPKLYERNLTTRLKLLANMNITESRLPQDGAIKGEFAGKYLDMRVSCLPLNTGEKIVIRILDYSRSLEGIEKLGFNQTNLDKIKRMMAVPNGIILVTGATGSGKSTTTYSMLQELNRPQINIITVEDPIEMNIEGLNQVQVNAEIGMTFAAALRSILRQDPNIILIGEIRDSETAQIAVRASITGHLVLSTIHTNNSLSTIERLLDMDVERYLLSTALTGIISQRLAKRLCPYCRIERATTKYEQKVFKKFMNRDVEKIYDINPAGCNHCRNGYRGRIAIHEVLELDDDIRNALSNNKLKKEELSKMVYGDKTITMLQDALGKAISGLTTFEEVYRVIELESDPEDDTAYLTRTIEDVPENESTTYEFSKESNVAVAADAKAAPINLLPPEQAKAQAEAAKQKLQEQQKVVPTITDLIKKQQEQNNERLVVEKPDLHPTALTQATAGTPKVEKAETQPKPNEYQLPKPANEKEHITTPGNQKAETAEKSIPELNIAIKTSNNNRVLPSVEDSPLVDDKKVFDERDRVEEVNINKISQSPDLKKENKIINTPLKPTVNPVEMTKQKAGTNAEPVIIDTFDIKKSDETKPKNEIKASIMTAAPSAIDKTSSVNLVEKNVTEKAQTPNSTNTPVTASTSTTTTQPIPTDVKKGNTMVLPVINSDAKKVIKTTNSTGTALAKSQTLPSNVNTAAKPMTLNPDVTTTQPIPANVKKVNTVVLPVINSDAKKVIKTTNSTRTALAKSQTLPSNVNTAAKPMTLNPGVTTTQPIPANVKKDNTVVLPVINSDAKKMVKTINGTGTALAKSQTLPSNANMAVKPMTLNPGVTTAQPVPANVKKDNTMVLPVINSDTKKVIKTIHSIGMPLVKNDALSSTMKVNKPAAINLNTDQPIPIDTKQPNLVLPSIADLKRESIYRPVTITNKEINNSKFSKTNSLAAFMASPKSTSLIENSSTSHENIAKTTMHDNEKKQAAREKAFEYPAIKNDTIIKDALKKKDEKKGEMYITEMKKRPIPIEKEGKDSNTITVQKEKKEHPTFLITEMKNAPLPIEEKKKKLKTIPVREEKKEHPTFLITEMRNTPLPTEKEDNELKTITSHKKEKENSTSFISEMKNEDALAIEKESKKKAEKDDSAKKKKDVASATGEKEIKTFNFTVDDPKDKINSQKKASNKKRVKDSEQPAIVAKANAKNMTAVKKDKETEDDKPKINIFEEIPQNKEKVASTGTASDSDLANDIELPVLGED